MKTNKTGFIFILMLVCQVMLNTNGFSQQTANQLYEKALYVEEAKGELRQAIDLYQEILTKYPEERQVAAKALLHTGICYERLGLSQARKTYQDVINRYPEYKDEVTLAKQRVQQLELYAVDLSKQAEQHMKKGNELFSRWEYVSAVEEYKKAMELDPNSLLALNAKYYIGQSQFRDGKYSEALSTFTKLIKENPESNIAPVTELMISQVEHVMKNNKRIIPEITLDVNEIIDPETGISYRKIKTFTGKNDVIERTPGTFLSPNGKFLLKGKTIVPMDGSEPFDFIDMNARNCICAPDGKNIAFTSDSSIYVVPVSKESGRSTGLPKRLLSNCGTIGGVYWSSDSKRLFFSMSDKQKDFSEIYSLSLSNSEFKKVTNEVVPLYNPNCSPDGNTLVCTSLFADLWGVSTNGGKAIKLNDSSRIRYTAPKWTPDGKWVFSDETRKGWGRSLDFFQPLSKKEVKLTPPENAGTYLSFSSDNKKMLFFNPSFEFFWGMKIASSVGGPAFEPVPHLPVYGAQWSTDGKTIIADGEELNKKDRGELISMLIPIQGGKYFAVNLDVNMDGKSFIYNVSPDNKYLLFKLMKKDEKEDLCIIPFSGEERKTTGPAIKIIENWDRQGAHNTKLSWSADGKKLAVIHDEELYVYDLTNKSLNQITKNSKEIRKRWIDWSPDGSMISYHEILDKPVFKKQCRIIDSNEYQTITLIENDVPVPNSWSPDSKSVVIIKEDKLVIQNILDGETHTIIDLKTHWLHQVGSFCWSPNGKYLIIDAIKDTDAKADIDNYFLYKISLEGDVITEIACGDSSYKYYISCSPDGKWISYCYFQTEKVRPESTLWEADFEEVKEKLLKPE